MKQARTLNDKQLKSVFAHCVTQRHATQDRGIVAVSFPAGLRAKEIAALTIENVVDEKRHIRDKFILTKEQTKGHKERRVFVSKKLKLELTDYFDKVRVRTGCPALF